MRNHRMLYREPNELNQGERVLRSMLLVGFIFVLGIETWLLVQILLSGS